jgi:hypothetical protein
MVFLNHASSYSPSCLAPLIYTHTILGNSISLADLLSASSYNPLISKVCCELIRYLERKELGWMCRSKKW